MRIAFDIHGVLSKKFKIMPLLIELKEKGHTLIVISGKPVREMKEELENDYGYDISIFDEFYSIIDSVLKMQFHNVKVWYNETGWHIDDEDLWWSMKAIISEKYNIDVLIDNELKYKQGYLEDKFIFYNDGMRNNEVLTGYLREFQNNIYNKTIESIQSNFS